MVSHKLNAFLQGFQTDSPMVPFFANFLGGIVCDLLERIILKDVLRKATNLYQLIQIDPSDKNIRKAAVDICCLVLLPILKLGNLVLTQVIPKFLLLKKRLETFLKSSH